LEEGRKPYHQPVSRMVAVLGIMAGPPCEQRSWLIYEDDWETIIILFKVAENMSRF